MVLTSIKNFTVSGSDTHAKQGFFNIINGTAARQRLPMSAW
jgi:hypothetical protein